MFCKYCPDIDICNGACLKKSEDEIREEKLQTCDGKIEVAKNYAKVHYNEFFVASKENNISLFEAILDSVLSSGIARNLNFLQGILLCNYILEAVISIEKTLNGL